MRRRVRGWAQHQTPGRRLEPGGWAVTLRVMSRVCWRAQSCGNGYKSGACKQNGEGVSIVNKEDLLAIPSSTQMAANLRALVIVDMQLCMADPAAGVRNNPDAETNIALLLSAWRREQLPVVHVRHLSRTVGSLFWPGQAGVEFQPEFVPRIDEHVVEKDVPDAFLNTGLAQWLRTRGVDGVVVTGVSTNISVESTARTASNLGFKVVVVSDASFAFEKTDYAGVRRSAAEVHAMSLANLNGEFATVERTVDVCDAL